jgi:hypothetical protein
MDERRRKALEEMGKPELVAIVLRLQDQIREHRKQLNHAVEDGIAEGLRRAARKSDREVAS